MDDEQTKNDRERLRKFLQQYQRAKRRKKYLVYRWEQINSDMHDPLRGIDYTADRLMGGKQSAGAATLPESLISIEEKITAQRDEVNRWLITIESVIAKLPVLSTEREILELRYIDGHNQQDVCDLVFRCRSSCGDIEATALDKLMDDQWVRDVVNTYYAFI